MLILFQEKSKQFYLQGFPFPYYSSVRTLTIAARFALKALEVSVSRVQMEPHTQNNPETGKHHIATIQNKTTLWLLPHY